MISRAFKEVLVQLSKIIPILNHSTVDAFLQYAFAEGLTGVIRIVVDYLAYVVVDDVVEEVVVSD